MNKRLWLIVASIVVLLAVLVLIALLNGCISASSSTGAESSSSAKAQTKSAQETSSAESVALETGEMTVIVKDKQGTEIANIKTAPTKAITGSKQQQQVETDSIAKASAEASSNAVSKAVASLNWLIVVLVIAALFTVLSRVKSIALWAKKLFI